MTDGGLLSGEAVGFAIVGTGSIATLLASVVSTVPGAELRLVVGRNAAPAQRLAERYAVAWSDDVTGYLRSPAAARVEVVVVATPSGTHADVAVTALNASKHVLVEKPLDVTLAAADRIIEAERRTGGVVAVVSQHRFDPSTEKLLEMTRAGRLGRLTSAVASCAWWRSQSYYDSAPWRGTVELDGGGATLNQAIHIIDLLLAVVGEPVDVTARVATLAHDGLEVEDTAVATIAFDSGALAVVHATTAAFPGDETSLRVYGDKGSAVLVNDELVSLTVDGDDTDLVHGSAVGASVAGPYGAAHARQVEDLVRVVRARRSGDFTARPRVGSREGRNALAVVLAMYESR